MIAIRNDIALARISSFNIGGAARYFFAARSLSEVRGAMREARKRNTRVLVVGGGTNLLFPDQGFDGLVLKMDIAGIRVRGGHIIAGAGVQMTDLLEFTARKGLSGLEWAGGLPGTVGGAVRGNAGAFRGETKDAVREVRALNARTLRVRTWSRDECRFAYRTSVFKERDGKEIILSVTFALAPGSSRKIKKAILEKVRYRKERHPLEFPNVGSIFKNVPVGRFSAVRRAALAGAVKNDPFPVVPAAFLIAQAGLKGVARRGALISPKHPNFIVNAGHATADGVKALMAIARTRVKKKFGITLEPEVIEVR